MTQVGQTEGRLLNGKNLDELYAIAEEWESSKEGKAFMPLKRNVYPKRLASIDTEDDSKTNLKSIVYYDGKDYKYFTDRFEFITFITHLNTKGKLYIVCTNLEYDIINCFRGYWNLLDLFYGASLIFCKLKNSKIYFMDSMNHYKMSVKEQGDYIGLPKLDFDPDNPEYVKRDAEITYTMMHRHQKYMNEVGAELNYTSASSSLNVYKRKFLKDKISKLPDEVLDLQRNAYTGGRTEIFTMEGQCKKGEKIIYGDINSLYPYVMKYNEFPVPDTWYLTNKMVDYGVVHCDIEYLHQDYVPYFPYRYDNKLIFPIGKLRGWWSAHELHYGLRNGIIKINKVHKAIGYKKTQNYFSPFVDYFYGKRMEAKKKNDDHMSLVVKILMNSLYGKFAEKVESKKTFSEDGHILETVLDKVYYPSHTNFIISLYTTAFARTVLYEGMKKVVDKKGILYYCDTDSIIFKGQEDFLEIGKDLGQFKIEGIFTKAKFYLPKAYYLKGEMFGKEGTEHYKVKGVRAKFAEDFVTGGYVEYEKPVKLRESMKRVDKELYKPNMWLNTPKSFKASYTKRKVTRNHETEPLAVFDY